MKWLSVCFLFVVLLSCFALASAYGQEKNFFELANSGTPQDIQAAISNGANVNARDASGMDTPLIHAAANNPNPEVITVLLNAGADMKALNQFNQTALMLAAWSNPNPQVIATLLKAGADIEARDSYPGRTALMYAAANNPNPEVIIVLLKAGSDAKAKDRTRKTAFDYAKDNQKLKGTDALKQLEEATK